MSLPTHSYERSGNLNITNEIITEILSLPQDSINIFSSYRIEDTLFFSFSLKPKSHYCPNCGSFDANVKEYKERKINHSLLNNSKCVLHYYARRYVCKDCGKTYFEDNPFSGKGASISNLTILNVLKELKEPNATFTSVASHHNISVTQTQRIFDRFVQIPRQPLTTILCMDEVYTETSKKSKYSCLILDFQTTRLLDVIYDRKKYTLLNYFEKIPKEVIISHKNEPSFRTLCTTVSD